MKAKRHFIVIVIVLIAILSFVTSAKAALSFYTDRSAWESAVSGDIVIEDFESATAHFLTEGVNHAGLIDIEMLNLPEVNKWNAIDDGSGLWNIDGTHFYQGACYPPYPGAATIVHLPFSVGAFGGDFKSTYSSSGLMLEVNGLLYEFSVSMLSNGGTGFLGFISTDLFSNVTLFTLEDDLYYGESFGLDNVSFAVPEPTTMVLLGLGGLMLRKRRKV